MSRYNLRFDTVESPRDIRKLGDFMREHVGEYDTAKHNAWLDGVCLPAIVADERRALAWWQHGAIIGDAVLKTVAPNFAELKNFRVAHPGELKGRGLGGFLLRQAEHEAAQLLVEQDLLTTDANTYTLQLDTGEDTTAQRFFEHAGFRVVGSAELYQPGRTEVIMQKTVELV